MEHITKTRTLKRLHRRAPWTKVPLAAVFASLALTAFLALGPVGCKKEAEKTTVLAQVGNANRVRQPVSLCHLRRYRSWYFPDG